MQVIVSIHRLIPGRVGLGEQVYPVCTPLHPERLPGRVGNRSRAEVRGIDGIRLASQPIHGLRVHAAAVVGMGLCIPIRIGDRGAAIDIVDDPGGEISFRVELLICTAADIVIGAHGLNAIGVIHLSHAMKKIIGVSPGTSQ